MGAAPVGVQANLAEKAATPLVAVAASAPEESHHHELGPGGTACDLDAGSQESEAVG